MENQKNRPRKEFGQNFLRNQNIVGKMLETAQPQPMDIFLEIGPGEGVITKSLAPKVKTIVAVELDTNLCRNLKILLSDLKLKNVEIINDDILRFLRSRYHDMYHSNKPNKIIGSIPYQITSPLLHELANLTTKTEIDSAALLIQKEVAQKIVAEPPQAGYLSNFVQTFFSVQYITTVSRKDFFPAPKVDGTIVKLEPIIQPEGLKSEKTVVRVEKWSEFLHQGFKHPRKMLKKVFDEKILKKAGLNPQWRPQEIDLHKWKKLYELYKV